MTDEPRFLFVRLEAGLPTYRINGLFHAIRLLPGVEMVVSADIVHLSAEQRSLLLGQPVPKPARGTRVA